MRRASMHILRLRRAAAAALLVAAASASDFENWNPNERDPDGKTDAQLLVERAEFVREQIDATNIKDVAVQDLVGPPLNLAPDDARRLVEAVARAAALRAYLDRAELGHLAAALGDRTVESLAHLTAEELAALGADDAQRLRDAIRDRPPGLHDSLERVEAAVDQVAADLHAQGAAQWADLAADVAAEASDAIKGCASTLLFVISVALVAPLIAMCTACYILILEIALDGVDQVLCAYLEDVHVWQHMLGNMCNAIFVVTLAGPLLQAERRMVARVQVQAALGPLLRCMDSLKHRLTRRAVERREVNEGDVCPICHEELTDAEMGPLAFCRWGCGRAVHDECAKLWLTKSDSCVLCGAAWS